jgi:hypothetical protein
MNQGPATLALRLHAVAIALADPRNIMKRHRIRMTQPRLTPPKTPPRPSTVGKIKLRSHPEMTLLEPERIQWRKASSEYLQYRAKPFTIPSWKRRLPPVPSCAEQHQIIPGRCRPVKSATRRWLCGPLAPRIASATQTPTGKQIRIRLCLSRTPIPQGLAAWIHHCGTGGLICHEMRHRNTRRVRDSGWNRPDFLAA